VIHLYIIMYYINLKINSRIKLIMIGLMCLCKFVVQTAHVSFEWSYCLAQRRDYVDFVCLEQNHTWFPVTIYRLGVGLWCLTPLSIIFQLYRADQYY
jgi:hypothetical protein